MSDLSQVFMDELLDDLQGMIAVSMAAEDNFVFSYRPDAQRRVAKYVRDWDHLMLYGEDIRGKTF